MAETRSISVSREYNAPLQEVWDMFKSEQALNKWFCPEQLTAEMKEFDFKVGGAFRVAMHAPNGETYTAFGTYTEITDGQRIAFTWQWEGRGGQTEVAVDFSDNNEQTKVTLTHSGFTEDADAAEHKQGWASSLNHLEKALS